LPAKGFPAVEVSSKAAEGIVPRQNPDSGNPQASHATVIHPLAEASVTPLGTQFPLRIDMGNGENPHTGTRTCDPEPGEKR